MSKNIFQDVIPPGRRSIRNVPLMGVRRQKKVPPEGAPIDEATQMEVKDISPKKDRYNPVFSKGGKRSFSGKIFVALGIILIAGFIFGMMTAFTSARVSLVPKKETVSFNLALKALKSSSSPSGILNFEVIDLEKEGSLEIPANGEEMAEKRAEGAITIYNNFSGVTQRLIARTRFENPEGLIYRIAESVVVPGKTSSGPGTVEAEVYADEAGEKYNIGKIDFTIPGFKNDNLRYKGFYAKSLTPMAGGFIGKIKKVSKEDKEKALETLKASLTEELGKEIEAKVPEGLVALRGGSVYNFRDLGQLPGPGSKAILKLEGAIRSVIFDKRSLSSVVAKEFLPEWREIPVEIRSFEEVAVSFDPGFDLSLSSIPLKLSGTTEVYALINGVEVADSLSGAPKESLDEIMSRFKGISSAKASIRPMWKGSFPSDTAKIHIIVE